MGRLDRRKPLERGGGGYCNGLGPWRVSAVALDLDPHELQSSAQELAPLSRVFLFSFFPFQL